MASPLILKKKNYLLLLSEKIPTNIKNTLQTLIKQAINNDEALTAHSFITGNNYLI